MYLPCFARQCNRYSIAHFPNIDIGGWVGGRTYKDKTYTSPQIFGQFFGRDFYVHQGISLKEYIGISIFFLYDAVPPGDTQLPLQGTCRTW